MFGNISAPCNDPASSRHAVHRMLQSYNKQGCMIM